MPRFYYYLKRLKCSSIKLSVNIVIYKSYYLFLLFFNAYFLYMHRQLFTNLRDQCLVMVDTDIVVNLSYCLQEMHLKFCYFTLLPLQLLLVATSK